MQSLRRPLNKLIRLSSALCWVAWLTLGVAAQSDALDFPTPVTSNQIESRIAPLDLGDARLTRHFYTFGGGRGDLALDVESVNLEGDVDLFTAGSLRPLTKITLYGGGNSLRVTKTVFLRAGEKLILRVQARSPNDADGTYRIRFGGTFVAAVDDGVDPSPPNLSPASATTGQNVRRVSSVGARIEEPKLPVEIAPVPAKTVSDETNETAAVNTVPAVPKRTRGAKPATTSRRKANNSRAAKAKAPAKITTPDSPIEESAEARKKDSESATETDSSTPVAATEKPATTTAKSSNRRAKRPRRETPAAASAREEAKNTGQPTDGAVAPETAPDPYLGARLVVLMRDGTRIEHEMSGVRRVTVEKGTLFIVLKNGKTERQLMSGVLRMAIEP